MYGRIQEVLADRAGEDVRVAMAAEPTALCHTRPTSHTPAAAQISMTTGMIMGRRRSRRLSHGPIARRIVCCSA